MVGKSGVVRSAVTLQEWASHQSTRRAQLLEQNHMARKFSWQPPDPCSPDLVGPPEESASKPVRVACDEPGPAAWLEPLLGGPDAGAPRIRVGERGGRDQACAVTTESAPVPVPMRVPASSQRTQANVPSPLPRQAPWSSGRSDQTVCQEVRLRLSHVQATRRNPAGTRSALHRFEA